jgi:tetratricopeptide (TPR) repeat protein
MSLPPDADPSGFLERAPSLAELLPDEAITSALARGDASTLHAALSGRLAVETSVPARETLQTLLQMRELFAMAEPAPRLHSVLGTGMALVGAPRNEAPEAPFVATRVFRLLGLPLWPMGQHLVRRGREGTLQVLGSVPRSVGFLSMRVAAVLGMGAMVFGGSAWVVNSVLMRELTLVNGLSRPVEVCVDGDCQVLQPEAVVRQERFALPGERALTLSWPGEAPPFKALSIPTWPRAVYNVLGVAPLQARAEPLIHSESVVTQPRPLQEQDALEDGEALELRPGGWMQAFRERADAGQWTDAAELAQTVALADATATQARELAVRAWMRGVKPARAVAFAEQLTQRHPMDVPAHQLYQDLLAATGRVEEARRHYNELSLASPRSLEKALLRARIQDTMVLHSAHKAVLSNFPEAPAALRAMARYRLASGDATETLELLDKALKAEPETLESLELRVRALASLKRVGEASNEVRRFGQNPKHHSWDFAVLAGRLARAAGPDRTQYITRDFLPKELLAVPERAFLFELASGGGTVKDKELQRLPPGATKDGLLLALALLTNLEQALELAAKASDAALATLEPDAAAVLALEFSRLGNTAAADRVFGANLPLLLGREPLETYVRDGLASGRFQMLHPGLRAAAHLVRARAHPTGNFTEYEAARAADPLQGFARRALDTWQDPRDERLPSNIHLRPYASGFGDEWHHHGHSHHIEIIRSDPEKKTETPVRKVLHGAAQAQPAPP